MGSFAGVLKAVRLCYLLEGWRGNGLEAAVEEARSGRRENKQTGLQGSNMRGSQIFQTVEGLAGREDLAGGS